MTTTINKTNLTMSTWLDGAEKGTLWAFALSREALASLRTFLENELREHERYLQRYESTLESIQLLVWPDVTDVQADAPDYLVKLVSKVGALVRSQAWEVERRHVVANRKLAEEVKRLQREKRLLETELRACNGAGLTPAHSGLTYPCVEKRPECAGDSIGLDANGSPVHG